MNLNLNLKIKKEMNGFNPGIDCSPGLRGVGRSGCRINSGHAIKVVVKTTLLHSRTRCKHAISSKPRQTDLLRYLSRLH